MPSIGPARLLAHAVLNKVDRGTGWVHPLNVGRIAGRSNATLWSSGHVIAKKYISDTRPAVRRTQGAPDRETFHRYRPKRPNWPILKSAAKPGYIAVVLKPASRAQKYPGCHSCGQYRDQSKSVISFSVHVYRDSFQRLCKDSVIRTMRSRNRKERGWRAPRRTLEQLADYLQIIEITKVTVNAEARLVAPSSGDTDRLASPGQLPSR